MPDSFGARLKHAWNAFMNRDPTKYQDLGAGYSTRPDRARLRPGVDRTIVSAIINRIAIDVASTNIRHVRLDDNDRFLSIVPSGLNECLTSRANIEQTGQAFIRDLVTSMCDEGVVAVVPVDTIGPLTPGGGYTIRSLRVGKIVEWYPKSVRILLYNDNTGQKEEITLPKMSVVIIENQF